MDGEKFDRLSWLDWLLICLLLVSLAGFGWYWYQSDTKAESLAQGLGKKWHNVLVIDMTLGTDRTESASVQGEDVILLAPPSLNQVILPVNLLDYVDIQNFQALGMLNAVTTNIFSPQDPAFSSLRLLVYGKKGTDMTLIPLYQAGIRAIELYRGRLVLRNQLNNMEPEQEVGYVIISDGSRRTIHLVPVHDYVLQGPATLVNH